MRMITCSVILAIVVLTSVANADSDNTAPTVVKCTPENGSTNVDPAVAELRVTFDEPMTADSWSWAYENKEDFPEITGSPYYLADQTTAVLPVKLEPNKRYVIWINTSRFQNFKDQSGKPAKPFNLAFETMSVGSAE